MVNLFGGEVFGENLGNFRDIVRGNSPGRRRRTSVWIYLDVIVGLILLRVRREDTAAILSKMWFTKEFMMIIALEETPALLEQNSSTNWNVVNPIPTTRNVSTVQNDKVVPKVQEMKIHV
ncbi:unnamed protein product [Lepeophtheirus salmonis]|uniref:(salmon louse) hypothetical protein n=1 Tax=Lepeophtheirus salmonis TaxID=72036 RepID=A0A817FGZ2_LEPSM|nr:unnamed protein product [Lepeophtheirus salmonis]CAG9478172.1 unnamed protein product [Lepeophtheirus salmonis]